VTEQAAAAVRSRRRRRRPLQAALRDPAGLCEQRHAVGARERGVGERVAGAARGLDLAPPGQHAAERERRHHHRLLPRPPRQGHRGAHPRQRPLQPGPGERESHAARRPHLGKSQPECHLIRALILIQKKKWSNRKKNMPVTTLTLYFTGKAKVLL